MALLGYGYGVTVALGAAERLADTRRRAERGRRPLRQAARRRADRRLAGEHDLVVTVEENVLAGGFGSGGAGAPRRPAT